VVKKLDVLSQSDPEATNEYILLLYDQAVIAEGGVPADPTAFARRLTALLDAAVPSK
jgi:HSP90 family molecular chaperone